MNTEQAQELRNSLLWRELIREIDSLINYEMNKLIDCPADDLVKIQERIKALQKMTRLPQDIIDREAQ